MSLPAVCLLLSAIVASSQVSGLNYIISTTWDGHSLGPDTVKFTLSPSSDGGLLIKVAAPFYNSPPKPDGPAGQPFPGLWNYEVFEAFFLNDKNQYLEVELGPYGQHLLLLLNGPRNAVKEKLPLTTFKAAITGSTWAGEAVIPREYFPPGVTKFNAYAIHGEGSGRVYESLYPASNLTEPDFHRLDFFKAIDISKALSNYNPQAVSDLWKPYQVIVG
jgi:hypothetical protein